VCIAAIPDIRRGQSVCVEVSRERCGAGAASRNADVCWRIRMLTYAWKSVESDVVQVLPHVMLTYAGVYVC
jgi:hypothetical protein